MTENRNLEQIRKGRRRVSLEEALERFSKEKILKPEKQKWDARNIIIASRDNTIFAIDVDGRITKILEREKPISSLFMGGREQLYDVSGNQIFLTLEDKQAYSHSEVISTACSFLDTNQRTNIFFATEDKIYELHTGKAIAKRKNKPIAICDSDRRLVDMDESGMIRDTLTGKQLYKFKGEKPKDMLEFNRRLYVAFEAGITASITPPFTYMCSRQQPRGLLVYNGSFCDYGDYGIKRYGTEQYVLPTKEGFHKATSIPRRKLMEAGILK